MNNSGLECLKELFEQYSFTDKTMSNGYYKIHTITEICRIIKIELEAFEIIRNKNVNVEYLKILLASLSKTTDADILERYNGALLKPYRLNINEYHLLKEVLE